jgi:hypothetical protein
VSKTRILLILFVVTTMLLDCAFAFADSVANRLVVSLDEKLSLECVWISRGDF